MFENIRKNKSYKWLVLAISFSLMLVFAISLQMLPPLFETITKDIPFSTRQAGILMSSYSVLGIFIPFIVVFSLDNLDFKKVIMVALGAVMLGLLGFSLASSYTLLLVFRLLSGAGATTLIVLAPLLVTMFFDGKNIGTAMGIFNVGVPTGTVISVNLFGYLALNMNWRSIMIGIIIFVALVFALVFFFLYLPSNSNEEEKNSTSSKVKFRPESSLIFLGIIWMVVNGQLLAYTTFAPQFYQSANLSLQNASFLTSMVMLVPIIITPFIGIMIDKVGNKKIFALVGLIIMSLVFFAIVTPILPLTFWAITLGIGFAFLPVVVFAILPDVVRPEHTGMGMATITAASNLGIAVGPAGFGSLLDITSGNFSIGFRTLSILSIICIFILFGVKTRNKEA